MRTRVLCAALVLSLSCAGMAFGQEAAKAKRPHRLADLQLDRVTAGDSGAGSSTEDIGGTIVAGGSQATINSTLGMTLEDGAQSGAQALNLVNATQSRVANGVNVWDGQLDSHDAATTLNVQQSNQVFQQGFASYASLSGYSRGQNVWTKATSSETLKSSSSDNLTNDSNVDTTQSLSSNGSPTTGEGQTAPSGTSGLQIGQGISGTGKLNISVDAGSVNVGLSAAANVTGAVKGLFSSGSGSASASFNAGAQWVLPKLSLSFDGGICYVEMGSCSAKGTRDTTSSSEDDKQASYSQVVQGPISIDNANAQNIVVDGSKLDATNSYTVFLNGTSEDNAKALNLVNATASLITNAVNIARTPTAGPTLNLNQTNLIVQQH